MKVIETHDLGKSFRTRQGTVEAVQGVSMHVEEGEIFGFLGPNGAGKSTTMRMLATLLPPDKGQAKVAGHDLRREPARVRERIGYVSQAGGADELSTGIENITLQGRLYGMSKTQAQARAAELSAALQLESFAQRRVSSYSGGQRRRLDIALGMTHRPMLLFLDEPTTGLDPQSRAHMWEEVRKLRDSGTTIFLTTHYLEEADALCDRLAIIDQGRIVAEGTPDSLKRQVAGDAIEIGLQPEDVPQAEALLRSQPFVRELHCMDEGIRIYVERGEEMLPSVLRILDGASLSIQTITLNRPSLDDVFLKMTGRSLRETDAA
ncbi:MAG TPA: ATP-binding cassette domain-containing protein [Oceanobacillus sp.]|nr:ATP-binding cassette domain-containing protein [Oceanobacillus sp.]